MDDADARRPRPQRDLPRADAPKGSVSVDVQAGVAYLRGEVAGRAVDRAPRQGRAQGHRASTASRTCCTRPARRRPPPSRGPSRPSSFATTATTSRAPGWPSPGHGASTINSRASLVALTAWRSCGSKTAAKPGAARRPAEVDLAVDHDDVGALVHLVLLQLLAGGQVDQDRPRLAARGVQDLRLVRLDFERAQVPVLHGAEPTPQLGGLAQPRDRLADDARHVHLRDADALADLGLREVLGEAQPQHLALAVAQHAHQPLDRGRVLGDAEARVLDARTRRRCRRRLLVVVARAVERDRAVGARRPRAPRAPARRVDAEALGDLGGRRRAAELARQLLADRLELTASSCRSRGTRTDQPWSRKWRLSSPRIVGTAKLENAVVAARVEAVDRLQQAERGDLDRGRRAARRRAGSGGRAGGRAAGSAGRAARAPRWSPRVGALEQAPIRARPRRPAVGVRRDMLAAHCRRTVDLPVLQGPTRVRQKVSRRGAGARWSVRRGSGPGREV